MQFMTIKITPKKQDWVHLPNYCNHDWLMNMNKNWNNVTFCVSYCPLHENCNWPL